MHHGEEPEELGEKPGMQDAQITEAWGTHDQQHREVPGAWDPTPSGPGATDFRYATGLLLQQSPGEEGKGHRPISQLEALRPGRSW